MDSDSEDERTPQKKKDDRVELIVKSAQDSDEYVMRVLPSATLVEIKAQLGRELNREEINAKGSKARWVKFLPNGELVDDGPATKKLGVKRILTITNALLYPYVPAPPSTVEDFGMYDPNAEVTSPRSLRACAAEGLLPEELIYVPMEMYFASHDFPPRLAAMRHDFVESYRQDIIRSSKVTRRLLMSEEDGDIKTLSSQMRNGFSPNASTAGDNFWSTGQSQFNIPAYGSVDDTIAGTGGTWTGPLASKSNEQSYPATYLFFSHHRGATDRGSFRGTGAGGCRLNLFEGPPQLQRPGGCAPTRFGSGKKPQHSQSMCDLSHEEKEREKIDFMNLSKYQLREAEDPAHDEGRHLSRKLRHLGGMKAQKIPGRCERMGGLNERTELQCVRQRRKDSLKLDDDQDGMRHTIERMVQVADGQKVFMEKTQALELKHRKQIDKCHQDSMKSWDKGVAQTNANNALKRGAEWNRQRDAIFANASAAEARRNQELEERNCREAERTKRVQQLQDLRKLGFARKWVDRSIRWSAAYGDVSAATNAFKKEINRKHDEAQLRTEDQQYRMDKYVETMRELKNLRRTFASMVARREQRRQEQRRQACAAEFERMAVEKMLDEAAEQEEDDAFFGSSMLSMGGGSAFSSPMRSRMSPTSSTMGSQLSPTHGLALRRKHQIPGRIDFPRLAGDVLSPLGLQGSAPPPSMSMQQQRELLASQSAPNFLLSSMAALQNAVKEPEPVKKEMVSSDVAATLGGLSFKLG